MEDEKWDQVQSELEAIRQRNARVEADKAWEVSYCRIGTICTITYVVAAALLWLIGTKLFWLGAIIPTVGFFLSTLSLPIIKRRWISSRYKDKTSGKN